MEEELEVQPDVTEETTDATVEETVTETAEEEQIQEDEPAKTFTQEELDATVQKRLARERRKLEREMNAAPKVEPPTEPVIADNYVDQQDYLDAKAEQIAAQKLAAMEANKVIERFTELEDDAIEKYPDYEEKVHNDKLPISEAMADVIKASNIGPELAYHLGSNIDEAKRISKLSPLLQAKELGVIEFRLANKPAPRTTKTPAPIRPLKGSSGSSSADWLNNSEKLSAEEWAAKRNKQLYG